MLRSVASILFLLTSLVVGLGAFGHDSNTRLLVDAFAKAPGMDAGLQLVILAVWHFCSGCMLVFGMVCLWSWWRLRAGVREALFAPAAIGIFYVVAGVASVSYTGRPFFWLFSVLGGLLLACGAIMSSHPAR
jgi:glycerol uptake facilitator-like aquaporin